MDGGRDEVGVVDCGCNVSTTGFVDGFVAKSRSERRGAGLLVIGCCSGMICCCFGWFAVKLGKIRTQNVEKDL